MEKKYYDLKWQPTYVTPPPHTRVYCCLADDEVEEANHLSCGLYISDRGEYLDTIMWALINK